MVQNQSKYADTLAIFIDGTEHEDIVEMTGARVGIVIGKDIAGLDIVTVVVEAAL